VIPAGEHSGEKGGSERMSLPVLLFGFVVIGCLALYYLSIALFSLRETTKGTRRVVATVKEVQVWVDGWYLIAVWTDILTGQRYTFRSHRIELRLKQRIGDSVCVDFDPSHPERYHMKL
jgi:hypothetical protein